jgi:cation diffusion facilitator CzcD-associated flavoprotein CzcO
MAGISLAHDVQQDGKNIQLTIYEIASDVGGTWFWNRCDHPRIPLPFNSKLVDRLPQILDSDVISPL